VQFNDQMKKAIERLLLSKYSGIKAAPMLPGLAEGTAVMDKVRRDLQDPPLPHHPVGLETLPPAAQDMTEQEAAILASKPKLANNPITPTPGIPAAPAAPAMPVSQAPAPSPELSLGSQYNDAARQKLYADLAAKKTQGAGWAAAAGLGDMARRMGGSTGGNAQENIMSQVNTDDKSARDQFETGRKAQVDDMSTNLALKKANRDETEYKDQNDPNSQQSRLAVALAQKYAPDQAKQLGWQAGKSTYADVIKVLPIMEKINAHESAKAAKTAAAGDKNSQFIEKQTGKYRGEVTTGNRAYDSYQTVKGMANSVRMAAKDPSAYGDLSSIYALVKGLDPTSVVREGEIGLMREVSGLRDQLVGTLQRWGGKGPITGQQMADIEKIMSRLEDIAADNVVSKAEPTLTQSRRLGIPDNEILGGDIAAVMAKRAAAKGPAAPKVTSGGFKVIR
jgi:hypothetical protein